MKKLLSILTAFFITLTVSLSGAAPAFASARTEQTDQTEHTTHTLKFMELQLPTDDEDGNLPCYFCTECFKYFADREAVVEVSKEKITLPNKKQLRIFGCTKNEYMCGSNNNITYYTNIEPEKFSENYIIFIGEFIVPASEYTIDATSPLADITILGKAFENKAPGDYYVTIKSKTNDELKVSEPIKISEPKKDNGDDTQTIDFGQVVLIASVSTLAVVCVVLAMLFLLNKRKRTGDK